MLNERDLDVVRKTALMEGLSLEKTGPKVYIPVMVVQYYWCLRVLMNGWGLAGKFLVPAKVYKDTSRKHIRDKFMAWDRSMNYAFRFLHVVLNANVSDEEMQVRLMGNFGEFKCFTSFLLNFALHIHANPQYHLFCSQI